MDIKWKDIKKLLKFNLRKNIIKIFIIMNGLLISSILLIILNTYSQFGYNFEWKNIIPWFFYSSIIFVYLKAISILYKKKGETYERIGLEDCKSGIVKLFVQTQIFICGSLILSLILESYMDLYSFFSEYLSGQFHSIIIFVVLPCLFILISYLHYYHSIHIYQLIDQGNQKEKHLEKMVSDAVEKRLESERMKIDLITNVSHDLKTPLTSIISYIELLQKMELKEEMMDYVDILSKKTEKLGEMIENLFDLAKVSSGNADIKQNKINLNRLIEQVLANMEDEIKKNEIPFKITLANGYTDFLADGNYIYRVCQNLLENALKYSLKGTRVYITTSTVKDRVSLTIINTASYEMDFTEEEIVERFTRGDKTRTTDGNGLGLAIVKSYTEACGGSFSVRIEGDQFKTLISFANIS